MADNTARDPQGANAEHIVEGGNAGHGTVHLSYNKYVVTDVRLKFSRKRILQNLNNEILKVANVLI